LIETLGSKSDNPSGLARIAAMIYPPSATHAN
jgi:hypothetical protein